MISAVLAAVTAASLSAADLAGKPIVLKVVLSNASDRVAAAYVRLRQFDAAGKVLPESVVDPRLLSGMYPAGFAASFEERGRVRPDAYAIRLEIDGRDATSFEVKGFSLARETDAPAADPSFFVPGVSGRERDFALALGGGTAFYFATQSQACWAEGHVFTDENDVYYPFGAGTVEAWFKPDWQAFAKAGGGRKRVATLFEAKSDLRAANALPGRGVRLNLTFDPATETFALTLRDATRGEFSAMAKAAFPTGRWTHLALAWKPGATAMLFVGGHKVATTDLKGYAVFDPAFATARESSDRWVAEFHLGSSYDSSRLQAEVPVAAPLFEGAVDTLRISSGVRYDRDFMPATDFRGDAATRALFVFNRFFDGLSSGGARVIPGTVRAFRGISSQTRKMSSDDLRPAFDLLNYRQLPSETECQVRWDRTVRTFDLESGGTASFIVPDTAVPDYVEIENRSSEPLLFPAVRGKGEVDPRSFSDMARSFRTWGATDRERADRVFQWLIHAVGYHSNRTVAYPEGGTKAQDMEYDALLMLNGYCAFECGPMNSLAAQVFAGAAGLPANTLAGYSHVFEHVYVDGRFRVYDLCARRWFPDFPSGAPATVADLDRESGIHHRLATVSPDFGSSAAPFVRMGLRGHYANGPQRDVRVGVSLNPGERFRMWRGNDGHPNDLQMRGGKAERVDRFFPDYANGFLVFDGLPSKANPAFAAVGKDSFVYRVSSGYPIVGGRYSAVRKDGSVAPVALSYDGGRTFVPVAANGFLVDEVLARHAYLVRVSAPVRDIVRFRALTEVQANPRVYTGLPRPGRNDMAFSADGRGSAHVSFAWRAPTSRPQKGSGGVFSGTVPGFGHRLFLGDISAAAPQLLVQDEDGTVTLSCPGAVLLTDPAGLEFRGQIPDGRYAVMVCNRFPARTKGRASSRTLVLKDPKDGKSVRFAGARSPVYEYLFDDYGPDEGRGRWKWDFLPAADGSMQTFEFAGADRVVFSSMAPADEKVEVSAVLLVPAPVGRGLANELVKTLCGLATVSGRVRAGGGRRLFFAGDSLLQRRDADAPQGSWGDALAPELDPDVEIVNLAIGGRSTKSFIAEGRWTNLVSRLVPGDMVLISFGSNDQSVRPELHTDPEGEYRANLLRFVEDVRVRGAAPMLTTPLTRRNFSKDGRLADRDILDYAAAMKKVASERKVPLVDMNALTRTAVERIGPEKALDWYAPNDGTHPSKAGAKRYAALFLEAIRAARTPIVSLFADLK